METKSLKKSSDKIDIDGTMITENCHLFLLSTDPNISKISVSL